MSLKKNDNDTVIKYIFSFLIFFSPFTIGNISFLRGGSKFIIWAALLLVLLLCYNKILSHKKKLSFVYTLLISLFSISLILSVFLGKTYKDMFEYTKYHSTPEFVLLDLITMIPCQLLIIFLLYINIDTLKDVEFYIMSFLKSSLVINGAAILIYLGSEGKIERFSSFFVDPNYFGRYQIFVFSVVFCLLLFASYKKRTKILLLIYASLSFILLVLSYSRASLIAFVVIAIVILLNTKSTAIKYTIIAIFLVVFSFFLIFMASQRGLAGGSLASSLLDISNSTRIALNIAAYNMFIDNIWFGVGYYNFYNVYINSYYVPIDIPLNVIVVVVHSWIFSIMAELGLFGLIPFIVLMFYSLRNIFKIYRKNSENKVGIYGLILFCFLFTFVFHGLFFPIFYPELFFALVSGLIGGYLKVNSPNT